MQDLAKVILHCDQTSNLSSSSREMIAFNPSVEERQAWASVIVEYRQLTALSTGIKNNI